MTKSKQVCRTCGQDLKRPKSLGPRIRYRRLQLGLSQTALGDLVDVSHAQISAIERGVTSPRLTDLRRLAEHLKTPLSFLIGK